MTDLEDGPLPSVGAADAVAGCGARDLTGRAMTPSWRPRAFQTIASVWIFLAATVADLKALGYTSGGKIQRKFSGAGPVRRIFYFLENDGIRLHYCVPYACQKGAFLASSAVLAFRRISNLSVFRGVRLFDPHLQHHLSC